MEETPQNDGAIGGGIPPEETPQNDGDTGGAIPLEDILQEDIQGRQPRAEDIPIEDEGTQRTAARRRTVAGVTLGTVPEEEPVIDDTGTEGENRYQHMAPQNKCETGTVSTDAL